MSDNQHQPLQFTENQTFPVFQLYAINGNKKTSPVDAMKISILSVMEWLRDKNQGKAAQSELIYPQPNEYDNFDLSDVRPIHIRSGHSIDALWLPEEQSFSLQIIEDDMGSPLDPDEPPVLGRKYITNIGIRIVNDTIEYGFKAEIAQPSNVKSRAKYLRMGIIKRLIRNDKIRLNQSYNILMNYYNLSTNNELTTFDRYLANKNVHLPVIVFSECEDQAEPEDQEESLTPSDDEKKQMDAILKQMETQQTVKSDILSLSVNKNNKHSLPEQLTLKRTASKSEKKQKMKKPIPQKAKKYIYPYSDNDILDKFVGFAHIFLLPHDRLEWFNKKFKAELRAGDAVIMQPICFGKEKTYFRMDDLADTKKINNFKKHIFDYLRTRNISYHDIIFYNNAIECQQEKLLSADMSKENLISSYNSQIQTIRQNYDKTISDMTREINSLNGSLSKKNNEINCLKNEISDIRKKYEDEIENNQNSAQKIENYYKDLVDWYKKRINRPTDKNSIPTWVADNFSSRMIMHTKAINLLSNWKPSGAEAVNLLYDALEYLGSEYYDCYFKIRSEDEINLTASQKYNRKFTVTNLTPASINNHPRHYKIKYIKKGESKAHEVGLDVHLKAGVDSERLIRIYFFIDTERRLLVIGSLPEHLPTSKE